MAKMFKKSVALGSQIAPLDMAWFTYWYQSKNDFFGPSLVLTPLIALETPKNLWKHMAICQYLTQDTKSTKFEPFWGFLGLGMTLTTVRNGVKIRIFALWPLVFDWSPLPNYGCYMKSKGTCRKLRYRPFIWYLVEYSVTKDLDLPVSSKSALFRNLWKIQYLQYYQSTLIDRRSHPVSPIWIWKVPVESWDLDLSFDTK